MKEQYHPETYWTEVGKRIKARDGGENVIAGDDEPYYRYKRERFIEMLQAVEVTGRSILEVGCGPGGNLLELYRRNPANLTGADISAEMVALAKNKLPEEVNIIKINGTELPFDDDSFDIVFTATVLQHNTNETMLRKIMKEICRVSSEKVYLFERIEKSVRGDALCLGRPVSYYSAIMEENGFTLRSQENINIRASYYVSGTIRKLFNPRTRKEGEPLTPLAEALQKATLPLTRPLDKIFPSGKDLSRLEFIKKAEEKLPGL